MTCRFFTSIYSVDGGNSAKIGPFFADKESAKMDEEALQASAVNNVATYGPIFYR